MRPRGFAGADPIGAGDGQEMAAKIKPVQQQFRQVRPLVGGDRQDCAAFGQAFQGLDDTLERPRAVGDMGGVIDQEPLKERIGPGPFHIGAGRLEPMRQQGACAGADQGPRRFGGRRGQSLLDQQTVQGSNQIWSGIDQGAVQIEEDGPAVQVTQAHIFAPSL